MNKTGLQCLLWVESGRPPQCQVSAKGGHPSQRREIRIYISFTVALSFMLPTPTPGGAMQYRRTREIARIDVYYICEDALQTLSGEWDVSEYRVMGPLGMVTSYGKGELESAVALMTKLAKKSAS